VAWGRSGWMGVVWEVVAEGSVAARGELVAGG